MNKFKERLAPIIVLASIMIGAFAPLLPEERTDVKRTDAKSRNNEGNRDKNRKLCKIRNVL